jgi:hypothetical protein
MKHNWRPNFNKLNPIDNKPPPDLLPFLPTLLRLVIMITDILLATITTTKITTKTENPIHRNLPTTTLPLRLIDANTATTTTRTTITTTTTIL